MKSNQTKTIAATFRLTAVRFALVGIAALCIAGCEKELTREEIQRKQREDFIKADARLKELKAKAEASGGAIRAYGGTVELNQTTLDKNEALTYQQVIEAPGKTKQQLYVALNYWVTATFKDKQAITLNDKEAGSIIVSSTIDAIADHTGTLFRYVVSITPVIKLDIKEGKVRVTYTVQNYDVLKVEDGGWLGGIGADKDDQKRRNQTIYSDGKRLKNDNTDRRLYDEQWEITKHYPFVEKDAQKRTCSKALVMTHAYSNAIIDKVEEAIKNGITGADDDDW